MVRPYYRHASSSLVVLKGVALLFSGIVSADYTPQQINQECSACDDSIIAAINTYQSDFGKWNKAIDGAKYHCARFAKLRSCYTDCLHDTNYTYSSSMKSVFDGFYSGICDPECYLAVLPYCYKLAVGTYDIAKSCSGRNLNQDLKRCVQAELFVKQNCSGVCTQGQRKALFYFFSTMLQCSIPYQFAYDCYWWTQYCSETVFGYDGAAYVSYANQTIIENNRLACSSYGDAFRDCVQLPIDRDVVIGTPPYSVTFNSPCADLNAELAFFVDFVYTMLVDQFCENPDQTFNGTCRAYAAPITLATSSQQTLSTPYVIISRATPQTAVPTTRATSHYVSTSLLTTSGDGSVTAEYAAATGNGSDGLHSTRQSLTPTTTTSATSSRPVEINSEVISRGQQTRAGGPGSSNLQSHFRRLLPHRNPSRRFRSLSQASKWHTVT